MERTQRQEQIISTAKMLFAERGYEATSMRDLAHALDMKASSIYNHFSSKHEILTTIAIGAMEEMLRSHSASQRGLDSPAERLASAMRTHVRFHANNKQAIEVTDQALKSLEAPQRDLLISMRRRYVDAWVDIIEAGITAGDFDCSSPKIAAFALIDTGIGVAKWFNPDGTIPLDDLLNIYAELALRSVSRRR